jgi:hypothetical protein
MVRAGVEELKKRITGETFVLTFEFENISRAVIAAALEHAPRGAS